MTEVPELSARTGAHGPQRGNVSRRGFLTLSALAGAALGTGAAACTHPVPVKQATTQDLSAPRAVSKPRWTADIEGDFAVNGFASLGATIVAWGDTEAEGFDAATGAAAWSLTAEPGSSALNAAWLGVFGETLMGISSAAGATLAGYDAAGRRTLSLPVSRAFAEAGIVTADRNIGCVGVSNGVAVIVAVRKWARASPQPPFVATIVAGIDLADGTRRWSREVAWYEYALQAVQQDQRVLGGTVSGGYCYVQDGEAIRAIELSSGAVRWTGKLDAPPAELNPTPTSGIDITPLMSVAGGAVVLSNSWQYAAFDAGTGARLWTKASTSVTNYAADGNRVYVLDGTAVGQPFDGHTEKVALIEAFDSRTGKAVWQVPSPPSLVSLGGVSWLTAATSTLLAGLLADGIVVLSAAGGQPLWAYQRAGEGGSSIWNALIAGSAVCALEEVLYAAGKYSRRTIYAFPPTVT